jgi:hypothetical protein
LPTFLLSIFFVLSNQWKEFIALLIISGNIFLWGIALILFKAYQMGGDAFVYQMLMFEGLGRLHNEHSTRLYFCFSNGLANYLITTFFAIVVLYIKRRDVLLNYTSPKDFLFQCCSVWFIMVLLLFTIPNTKEVRYVMPIFLPISLLAGYIFNEKATLEYVPQLRKMLVVTAWLLPIIGLLLILSEWFIQRFTHYLIPASLLSGGLLSLLMLITVYQWIGKRRSSVYFYPMLFILIILYLVLINSFILSPVSLYYDYPQGVNMLLPLF